MDCHEVKAAILDVAYGLGDRLQEDLLKAHLAQCEGCRQAWERALKLRGDVRSWGSREPSPELHARVMAKLHRPRKAWAVAVAAAALFGVALGIVTSMGRDEIEGTFQVREGEAWRQVTGSMRASAGMRVRATDARIHLIDGSELSLGPGSEFRFAELDRVFEQTGGEIAYRVRRMGATFEVRTPTGVVKVLGTEFTIRIVGGEGMNVKTMAAGTALAAVVGVTSGLVAVSNSKGETRVGAGQVAVLKRDAAPEIVDAKSTEALKAEERALTQQVHERMKRCEELTVVEHAPIQEKAAKVPPKGKGSAMRTLMTAQLKAGAKVATGNLKKDVGLDEEQTKQVEALVQAMLFDALNAMFAEKTSADELERLARSKDTLSEKVLSLLREDQKLKFKSSKWDSEIHMEMRIETPEYESLVKGWDPTIQELLRKECDQGVFAMMLAAMRMQLVGELPEESQRLAREVQARTLQRIGAHLPPSEVEKVQKYMGNLSERLGKTKKGEDDVKLK